MTRTSRPAPSFICERSCCFLCSSVQYVADIAVAGEAETGEDKFESQQASLTIAESAAVKAKPGTDTFISSVLKARAEAGRPDAVVEAFLTRIDDISFAAFGDRCRIRYLCFPSAFLAARN